MKFLRSLTGKGREAVEDGRSAVGTTAAENAPDDDLPDDGAGARDSAQAANVPDDDLPDDDVARDTRLQRDFQAGLSDLARRQLQYAEYSLKPPSQVIRTGTWILTEPTEGRDTAGRSVPLSARTPLVFIDGEPPVLRFRTADGREVDLDVERDEAWPAFLVRESDLEP
ncbi:MAG TPA: hypothetical protein VIM30_16970 [Candidatus Limnocylindrales bacterium]